MSNGSVIMKYVFAAFIAAFVAFAAMGAVIMQQETLVKWWLPLVVVIPLGAGAGFLTWRFWAWLMDWDNKVLCMVVQGAAVSALLWCGFYAANTLGVREGSQRTAEVPVERLFKEKHRKTRRVSRRVVRYGPEYWVYKAEVRFAGGRTKDLRISKQMYNNLSKGDSIEVEMVTGLFGFDIVKEPYKPFKTVKPKKRRDHNPYRRHRLFPKHDNDSGA